MIRYWSVALVTWQWQTGNWHAEVKDRVQSACKMGLRSFSDFCQPLSNYLTFTFMWTSSHYMHNLHFIKKNVLFCSISFTWTINNYSAFSLTPFRLTFFFFSCVSFFSFKYKSYFISDTFRYTDIFMCVQLPQLSFVVHFVCVKYYRVPNVLWQLTNTY